MDLLTYLQNEIEILQLKDKLKIARFIYIKTGELFDYDESYYTYKYHGNKQLKIYSKNFNKHKVNNFKIVCASWSRLYKDLLNAFSIRAEYIESYSFGHAYVKFYIGKKKYIADLTAYFEDITKIKFGFKTTNFYYDTFLERLLTNSSKFFKNNHRNKFLKIDKEIKYFKGIYMDDVFPMIKKELLEIAYTDPSQLFEKVLDTIMLIMNIERPYIEFFSGTNFIDEMLNYFLGGKSFFIRYTNVYDKDRTEFIGVFVNTYNEINQFYLYKRNNKGFYKLKKESKDKVKKLAKYYECSYKKVLKLAI